MPKKLLTSSLVTLLAKQPISVLTTCLHGWNIIHSNCQHNPLYKDWGTAGTLGTWSCVYNLVTGHCMASQVRLSKHNSDYSKEGLGALPTPALKGQHMWLDILRSINSESYLQISQMVHGSLLDSVANWLVTSLKSSRRELAGSFLGLSVLAVVGLSSWDDITCTVIFTTTFALCYKWPFKAKTHN